jgi:hypothetical protein
MTCILSASVANVRCNPNLDGQRTIDATTFSNIHMHPMNFNKPIQLLKQFFSLSFLSTDHEIDSFFLYA